MLETNLDRIIANAIAEGVLLGKQEVKQEGRLEGKLEGESTLLERLIAKRFGSVSEDTRARLRAATANQLESWAERILDARTLAEVFNEH